jgi:glycosyltransferase involved in cell wall biosynthesis
VPKLSVIIPTYNREGFIGKAIDSVLNQSFEDYEIVVIDDGSTDDTRKVLEEYKTQIKYVYQSNSGVSSARNAGILHASGEWIAFLDSDDEWTRGYLSAQMQQIERYPHAVGHITNGVRVSLEGKRSNYFAEVGFLKEFGDKACVVFERPLRVILNHELGQLQSTIVRKEILLQTGLFDTQLSVEEDLDVIARSALRGAFTFCRRELVEIFRREESIENLVTQNLKKPIDYYESLEKIYAGLFGSDGLTWEEKAIIARKRSTNWSTLGNALVMAGKGSAARGFYKKSAFTYPSTRSLIKFLATFLPQGVSRAFVRKPPFVSIENVTVDGKEYQTKN